MKPIFAGIFFILLVSNAVAQNTGPSWFYIEKAQKLIAAENGTNYIVHENRDQTVVDIMYSSEGGRNIVDTGAVILYQNVPNPFTEQTTIRFYVRENVQQAQLNIYADNAKLIFEFPLTERGYGEIKVRKPALKPGTYNYALIINGVNVASRVMEKQ